MKFRMKYTMIFHVIIMNQKNRHELRNVIRGLGIFWKNLILRRDQVVVNVMIQAMIQMRIRKVKKRIWITLKNVTIVWLPKMIRIERTHGNFCIALKIASIIGIKLEHIYQKSIPFTIINYTLNF